MTSSEEIVPEEFTPPQNYEEYLKAEGLSDWPFPMSLENPLDIQSEGNFMGSQENIAEILRASAPLGWHMLNEMERRLDAMNDAIYLYANEILTEDVQASRFSKGLFHSPSSTFITEGMEHLKSHRNSRAIKSFDLLDTMMESRKKSLDNTKFPGFVQGELIDLPSQLEVPPILHRVTTAQEFNPGFENFWKKLFLSEASSTILQDMFWWVFLDMFIEEEEDQSKDLLFDRIADSYVALFTSINADVKDKFLTVYPNCLAQAIYCAFKDAFPESKWRFNSDFKQYLVTLTYELITGLRPTPNIWKSWNEEGLEQVKSLKETEKVKMLEATGLHERVELSLDMDSFNKTIDKLGTELSVLQTTLIPRETTKTSQAKGKTVQKESHQIGPGPSFEQVTFNTSGRSPLIAHYLHMRKLRNFKQPGMKVRRTEIVKLPPEGPTYEQLIASTNSKAISLRKEYERTCEQTEADILELHKKQRDINRRINALKRAFNNAKTIQERQLLIDNFTENLNSKEVLTKEVMQRPNSQESTVTD